MKTTRSQFCVLLFAVLITNFLVPVACIMAFGWVYGVAITIAGFASADALPKSDRWINFNRDRHSHPLDALRALFAK